MSAKKFSFEATKMKVKGKSGAPVKGSDVADAIADAMREHEKNLVNNMKFESAKSFDDVVAAFDKRVRAEAPPAIKNIKAKAPKGVIASHIIGLAFDYEMDEDSIQRFLDLWKSGTAIHAWFDKRGVQVASHAGTYEFTIQAGTIALNKPVSAAAIAIVFLGE